MARDTVASGRMALRCWFYSRVVSFELQVFCINRAMVTFCSGRSGRRSAQRDEKEIGLAHNDKILESIT